MCYWYFIMMLLVVSLFLFFIFFFFFFKQKTAYEMRISDWSSDVCSSDLGLAVRPRTPHVSGRLSPPCVSRTNLEHTPPMSLTHISVRGAREIGRASCRERVCQYV